MNPMSEEMREALNDQIIVLLAEGRSYEEAAALAGCSSKTIQRRLRDPEFALAVLDRRRERVRIITGLLVGASERAVAVLTEAMASPKTADRLRAAGMLLGQGRRFHLDEVDNELPRRLSILEAKIDPPLAEDEVDPPVAGDDTKLNESDGGQPA